MSSSNPHTAPSFTEFVILMALMISLVALSIDAMLPALPAIAGDLGAAGGNASQLVIGVFFVGMAAGQLLYGPLSDSWGRKRAIYLGIALFLIGCLCSLFAQSFGQMLGGRLLQGLGAAGPRIVAVALVRDRYQGRVMARVMSFVMTVFILVPVIAPAFGQLMLWLADWHAIFVALALMAATALIWFALRQPETLPPERRRPFRPLALWHGLCHVLGERMTLGYTLASGVVFGAFIGYLNSAQALFQDLYRLGSRFPLYFGILALSVGAASLLNTRLVMRYGMARLCRLALMAIALLALLFLPVLWQFAGVPPLWMLMLFLQLCFFAVGMLFGNLNAQAMEPLGAIAGLGAAVVGSLSTFISVPLGVLIGQSFNATLYPLVSGFALLSLTALALILWAERSDTEDAQ